MAVVGGCHFDLQKNTPKSGLGVIVGCFWNLGLLKGFKKNLGCTSSAIATSNPTVRVRF